MPDTNLPGVSSAGSVPIVIRAAAESILAIASGSLLTVPLDMSITRMTKITLTQVSQTQDFSLRAWVSLVPNGTAVGPLIAVLKTATIPLIVHTAWPSVPANSYAISVSPGWVMLNVLNLTNEPNMLSLVRTDLA